LKKELKIICLIIASFVLCSCAAKQLPPPEWIFQKEAIRLHIMADDKLNFYEDTAHTLALCIYQLTDPNSFNQFAGDEEGLYSLLECGLFEASVATAKRLIIHPDQEIKLILDRAENAKYLGVVAGYNMEDGLEKERMIRLFEIPVEVISEGIIKKKKYQQPALLNVDIDLGAQQIRNVEG